MNHWEYENLECNVKGFIGFLVSPETEKTLVDFTHKIKKISDDNSLNFKARWQCFHATIEYYQWNIKNIQKHVEKIEDQMNNFSKNRIEDNGINPSQEFDESFHKIGTMVSYVNNRVYLCLFPHNKNPLLNEIWNKSQAHISLWYFPEGSLQDVEKFLWTFKSLRDQMLWNNHFALDFSKIYNQVK